MSQKSIQNFYNKAVQSEWKRLVKDPYKRVEFDTTLHFLEKYLPNMGYVLDAGGGPGRYTIELAHRGFDVALLDLTPALLEKAQKQIRREAVTSQVKHILQGSVDDLSAFDDHEFDGVLCLGGVISHIMSAKQREKAISELARVAKKDAPIFISVIGRWAVLTEFLTHFPEEIGEGGLFEKVADYGILEGDPYLPSLNYFTPEELVDLLQGQNLQIVETIGLEGLATLHQRKTNQLARKYSDGWKKWLTYHYKLCTQPSIIGMSENIMIIGRKSSH